MDNLLYYPYINIPKADWVARALLYYDRVGSIVPQRYFYGDYDPYMREIVDNGLVEPINPMCVLERPWEITRPFIEYVKSKDFNIEKRRLAFKFGKTSIHQDKFSLNGPRIHVDKFDRDLFYHLEHAGLAIRQDDEWYKVERKTANDLMAFLASVIGGKLQYRPTTDQERKRFRFKESKKDFESFKTLDQKRELILNELIPFPEQIEFAKLRKFKERNAGSLRAFRNQVELIVLNPNIDINAPLFTESINELKLRSEELAEKMNENKLGKIFFGTVCGMIGAGIGLASSGTIEGAVLGLPGFANAIYSALQIEKAEGLFDQSGMKYLALVDKQLGKYRRIRLDSK